MDTAVRLGNDLTRDRLQRILAHLRVYRRNGIPALYQPITLLWAFSRARRGEPRLVSWPETQRQVKALLNSYGRDGKATASSTRSPPPQRWLVGT
jgi:hypothetical protein